MKSQSEFEEVLSMKRWLSILAVFGCIVALSGCKNENEKRQAYFNAKVFSPFLILADKMRRRIT